MLLQVRVESADLKTLNGPSGVRSDGPATVQVVSPVDSVFTLIGIGGGGHEDRGHLSWLTFWVLMHNHIKFNPTKLTCF